MLACCMLLAACGGEGTSTGDRTVGTSGGPTDAVTADGPPVDNLALSSDVLRLALERPESYRPTEVALTDQSAVIIADLLYDGLTEAVGNRGELRPGLAEAWWHNEDYTVWTFLLDPGADITTASVVSSLLPFASESATIEKSRPGVAARLAAGIRAVSRVDDRTVTIELDGPNAGLPWVLSGLPFSVVGPNGAPTGTYRISSDDAAGLRLTARQTERPSGATPVRPVRIEWQDDREAGYQKLVDGKLDGALVPADRRDDAAAMFPVGPSASVSTRFYVLHLGSARLADPMIRGLIHSALDGGAGAVEDAGQETVVADGLVPNTMAGYRPDPCSSCGGLLSASSTDSPSPPAEQLEVAYSGPDQRAMTMAIVERLQAAGIPAIERRMDPEDLASVIVSGGTDIFSFGWVAAATSSDAILPVLLSAESPANVARIGSAEIDRILAAAAVTADDNDRWDLHHQAHQAALSSGRLLPVAAVRTSLALSSAAGPVVVRADGSIDLEVDG